jgi:hypothetical protein
LTVCLYKPLRFRERACSKSVSGSAGTIHIELRLAQVRIEGSADPSCVASVAGVFAAVIVPPANTRIWIAASVTELRPHSAQVL